MKRLIIVEDKNLSVSYLIGTLEERGFDCSELDVSLIVSESVIQSSPAKDNILTCYDLIMDVAQMTVSRAGQPIKLTPQEFRYLKYLLQNQNRILTRDQIIQRVWGINTQVETRVVDVYSGYLRNKIDKGFDTQLLKSVRGFGYMLYGPTAKNIPSTEALTTNSVNKMRREKTEDFIERTEKKIAELKNQESQNTTWIKEK